MDGLELTRALAGDTHVVVVTTFDLDSYVHEALRAGAAGFLLKRSGPTLLVEAVRAAMAGDALISPQITVRLLRHLTRPAPAPEAHLTERERQVAELVGRGHGNTEIAEALHISAGTAKNHVAALQRKLGVRNRVGIARWAWSAGLLGPDGH
jgi:DNA-binding NarL/FixJ family response regulator